MGPAGAGWGEALDMARRERRHQEAILQQQESSCCHSLCCHQQLSPPNPSPARAPPPPPLRLPTCDARRCRVDSGESGAGKAGWSWAIVVMGWLRSKLHWDSSWELRQARGHGQAGVQDGWWVHHQAVGLSKGQWGRVLPTASSRIGWAGLLARLCPAHAHCRICVQHPHSPPPCPPNTPALLLILLQQHVAAHPAGSAGGGHVQLAEAALGEHGKGRCEGPLARSAPRAYQPFGAGSCRVAAQDPPLARPAASPGAALPLLGAAVVQLGQGALGKAREAGGCWQGGLVAAPPGEAPPCDARIAHRLNTSTGADTRDPAHQLVEKHRVHSFVGSVALSQSPRSQACCSLDPQE